jgi:hypothetical protein
VYVRAQPAGRQTEQPASRSRVQKFLPRQIGDLEHLAQRGFSRRNLVVLQVLQELAPVISELKSLSLPHFFDMFFGKILASPLRDFHGDPPHFATEHALKQ